MGNIGAAIVWYMISASALKEESVHSYDTNCISSNSNPAYLFIELHALRNTILRAVHVYAEKSVLLGK